MTVTQTRRGKAYAGVGVAEATRVSRAWVVERTLTTGGTRQYHQARVLCESLPMCTHDRACKHPCVGACVNTHLCVGREPGLGTNPTAGN